MTNEEVCHGRLMVVDDTPANLDLLVSMLETLGYEIGVATTGESALEIIPRLRPDLILLDVMLPGIDGYETCRRLKADEALREIPVIFITAKTEIRDLKTGFETGAVDYIRKPIQREEVVARVRTHVHLRSLRERLSQHNRQLSAILSVVMDGTFCVDMEGRISCVNPAALALLGYEEDELIGQSLGLLSSELGGSSVSWQKSPIYDICMHGGEHYSERYYFKTRTYGEIPVEFTVSALTDLQGAAVGAIVAFRDITEKRDSQQQLISLLSTDQLTGLVNWGEFSKCLDETLADTRGDERQVLLLLVDIDDFRDINDSLGHDIGDQLLVMVAERFTGALVDEFVITRHGGDEFALFTVSDPGRMHAEELARWTMDLMKEPFLVQDNTIFLTISIGVVVNDTQLHSAKEMFRAADLALFQAKERGKGRYDFYSEDMQRKVLQRVQMTHSLREGLREGELMPYFQPIVDASSGLVIGAEALIRWHAESGLVPPDQFIGVAESSGLIDEVGDLVLNEVCRHLKAWQPSALPLVVGINVSAKQLRNREFPVRLQTILDRHGIPPSALSLELTESTLMDEPDEFVSMFGGFQEQDLDIAIDDFGTGFSSLSYLARMRVNTLKIDRSFVAQIGEDKAGETIIRTIIGMAHSLGLKVVGEGVETEQQQVFLRDHGCDMLQGYLFGKPMPAIEFHEFLVAKPEEPDSNEAVEHHT
jgi:diguanylate cyclase (GGDEF)-like protein/PAS domain S-box-containing protein